MKILDYITLFGTYFSLLGVGFAIYQLAKTRKAAEAASRASDSTKELISHNLLLADLSTGIQILEEIKLHIRHKRYEAALLRITDLIAELIQINSQNNTGPTDLENMSPMITQLTILREMLEKKLHKSENEIDVSLAYSVLSKISDELNARVGKQKFFTMLGVSKNG